MSTYVDTLKANLFCLREEHKQLCKSYNTHGAFSQLHAQNRFMVSERIKAILSEIQRVEASHDHLN